MAEVQALTDAELERYGRFFTDDERQRLSAIAGKAVPRILGRWGVGDEDGPPLLGVLPASWPLMKSGKWRGELTREQLLRASSLIGIWGDLHAIFVNDMAVRWPTLVNKDPIFGNRSPVKAMLDDGVPQMFATRQYLTELIQP